MMMTRKAAFGRRRTSRSSSRPTAFRTELTRPFCGAISKSFWNSRATATVGSTTGKKTSVRISVERVSEQKT